MRFAQELCSWPCLVYFIKALDENRLYSYQIYRYWKERVEIKAMPDNKIKVQRELQLEVKMKSTKYDRNK